MDVAVVAAEAAGLIWSLVRRAAGSAADTAADAAAEAGTAVVAEEAKGVVARLWDRLRGTRTVEAAAEDDAPDALEELARQIGRLLERDEALATEVASLVAEARRAGAVVDGHALIERVRAQRDVIAEGTSATIRDADAGGDVVARAQGAPPKG